MMRDVDSDFLHDRNRVGSDVAWDETSAENFKAIARHLAQQALAHLAARYVAGADDQHSLFVSHQFVIRVSGVAHSPSGVQHAVDSGRLSSNTTKASHSFPSGSRTQVLS